MSEKKWTPGPWLYRARNTAFDNHEIGVELLSEETGLGGVKGDRYMLVSGCIDKHDAALIASAPDLYDALEWALSFAAQHSLDLDAIEKARSALSRARGETP